MFTQYEQLTATMKKDGDADRRRECLRAVMEEKGLNILQFAKRAGISPTSIYNFLRGSSSSLSSPVLEKLAKAHNVPIARLTGEPELTKLSTPEIRVIGIVEAGVWRESPELYIRDRTSIMVPVPETYRPHAFGLEVGGASMNLIYPEGSFVICVPIEHVERELRTGDRVVVRRKNGGTYEFTLKELAFDEDGHPWLWPRSSSPKHQQPIEIPREQPEGDEEISILSLIIGSYRPEPQ